MFNTAQKVELRYDGKPIWFEVWRYNTPTELHTALTKAGVRDFDTKTSAYTQTFSEGPECGRMHLLDSSIKRLATEASKMAFHLGQREHIIDYQADWEEITSHLIGTIISELYSKQTYY